MKSIGILYICTGPYKLFWEDFYKTSQKFFLKDFDKHYFIFTDDKDFFYSYSNKNIHISLIENLPWPLITLFRFRYFLSIKNQLEEMDYLFFSNSNMKFVSEIKEEEFLPDEQKKEEIFAAIHPGYIYTKNIYKPFDRNKRCSAYIPYNVKPTYVIGAINGGKTDSFLTMAQFLNDRIIEDLKHNTIARWHDESQINKYIAVNGKCKYLTPSFCYPFGFDLPFEKKIIAVSKQEKFDVRDFKGQNVTVKQRKLKQIIMNCIYIVSLNLRCFISFVKREKINYETKY